MIRFISPLYSILLTEKFCAPSAFFQASCGIVLTALRSLQTLVLLFSVDDLTGFEITYLLELPEPWGLFVVWGLVLPLVYIVSSSLTNLVLRDFLILKVGCSSPWQLVSCQVQITIGFRSFAVLPRR